MYIYIILFKEKTINTLIKIFRLLSLSIHVNKKNLCLIKIKKATFSLLRKD